MGGEDPSPAGPALSSESQSELHSEDLVLWPVQATLSCPVKSAWHRTAHLHIEGNLGTSHIKFPLNLCAAETRQERCVL